MKNRPVVVTWIILGFINVLGAVICFMGLIASILPNGSTRDLYPCLYYTIGFLIGILICFTIAEALDCLNSIAEILESASKKGGE